jgi:hypothetical protein
LNNVESSLFFPDMVEGTLKSALFYSLEEFRDFEFGGQW